MTDIASENYRWAVHTGGPCTVRAKDYRESDEEIEAETPYDAWKLLRANDRGLRPGDLLEPLGDNAAAASLLIAKYIGFEPASWFIPASKPLPGGDEERAIDFVSSANGPA
jgi:hypothetical protein